MMERVTEEDMLIRLTGQNIPPYHRIFINRGETLTGEGLLVVNWFCFVIYRAMDAAR